MVLILKHRDEQARSADAPRARDHGFPALARTRDCAGGPRRPRRAAVLLRCAYVPAPPRGARPRAPRAGGPAVRVHTARRAPRCAAVGAGASGGDVLRWIRRERGGNARRIFETETEPGRARPHRGVAREGQEGGTLMMSLELFVRGGLVLAVALGAVRLLRSAPAALRASVLASALAAVLVLPVVVAIVPAWHVESLQAAPGIVAPMAPIAEPAVHAVTAHAAIAGVAARARQVPWGALVMLAWAFGAAAIAARAVVGAVRARRLARRGVLAERAYAVATDVWRAIGGRGAVPRIVTSREIDAPIVVGAVAPVVVVPAASAAWSAERWRVVLAHELSHVRRRDGLANVVAQLACAVHWFDPLAWLAARRLREERERAADDTVLRGGTLASTYAEHLVAIATPPPAPAGVLAMTDGARFEARIEALLERRSRAAAGAARTLAVVAAVAVVAGFAACVSAEAPASPAGKVVVAKPADARQQATTKQELDAAIAADHASGAIAIVIDAKSGAVLALAQRGNGAARAARLPGSTLQT